MARHLIQNFPRDQHTEAWQGIDNPTVDGRVYPVYPNNSRVSTVSTIQGDAGFRNHPQYHTTVCYNPHFTSWPVLKTQNKLLDFFVFLLVLVMFGIFLKQHDLPSSFETWNPNKMVHLPCWKRSQNRSEIEDATRNWLHLATALVDCQYAVDHHFA